jgi:hypothetical protein
MTAAAEASERNMNVVSLLMLTLGVLAIRIRTRRYIVNVASLLFVWQAIALLVGPGVAARNAIDAERAQAASTSAAAVDAAVHDAVLTSHLVTALSLVAWPFLLVAALKRTRE